jgi:hypothetical protein
MVSVVVSSAVDPGVNHGSGQSKDYKNCICYFVLSKDVLTQNQDNVSESSDMSSRELLLQLASIIQNKLSLLV